MSSLNELVTRLEKAQEGDRKLDRDIFLLVTPDWLERGIELCDATIPHYTTSIDAALTLVPEGWGWHVSKFPLPRAELAEPIETKFGPGIGIRQQVFTAKTPALALVIACLRARQQGEG